MNSAGDPDSRETEDGTHREQQPRPKGIIRRFMRLVGHPPAPHWVIAFFTLLLAVFAYKAWDEATNTTKILQGELNVAREQNRPSIYNDPDPPTLAIHIPGQPATTLQWNPQFDPTKGRILWPFAYKNYGRTPALGVHIGVYIQVGDEPMQKDALFDLRLSRSTDLPQTERTWSGGESRVGFSQDYFNQVANQDGGIKMVVEFTYTDTSGKERYSSGYCLINHNLIAPPSVAPVSECKK